MYYTKPNITQGITSLCASVGRPSRGNVRKTHKTALIGYTLRIIPSAEWHIKKKSHPLDQIVVASHKAIHDNHLDMRSRYLLAKNSRKVTHIGGGG